MRALSIAACAAVLAFNAPALAQDGLFGPDDTPLLDDPFQPVPPVDIVPLEPEGESQGDDSAAAEEPDLPRLDRLFADLKRERSTDRAALLASQIQAEWLKGAGATVDLLMLWTAEAIRDGNHGAAFDLLEQAMILEPDYAEAWNARATLNFQLSRYGRSLADIEQTLAREPRHFGALMGLAAILETLGRNERALETYMRVLEVYPALPSAQEAVGRLADEVGGRSL